MVAWQGCDHRVWPYWTFKASDVLVLSLIFFNHDSFALEIIWCQGFVLNQFIATGSCRLFIWIIYPTFWPFFALCKHYTTIVIVDRLLRLIFDLFWGYLAIYLAFLTQLHFLFHPPSSGHKFLWPHYKIQNHLFARNIIKCAIYDLFRTVLVFDSFLAGVYCIVIFGLRFWFLWVWKFIVFELFFSFLRFMCCQRWKHTCLLFFHFFVFEMLWWLKRSILFKIIWIIHWIRL